MPDYKLLIYSEFYHGWLWWYEVHERTRPKDQRIVISGVRTTWAAALDAGLAQMRRHAGDDQCSRSSPSPCSPSPYSPSSPG